MLTNADSRFWIVVAYFVFVSTAWYGYWEVSAAVIASRRSPKNTRSLLQRTSFHRPTFQRSSSWNQKSKRSQMQQAFLNQLRREYEQAHASELAAAYAEFATDSENGFDGPTGLSGLNGHGHQIVSTSMPVGMREEDLWNLGVLIPELQHMNDVSVKMDAEGEESNVTGHFILEHPPVQRMAGPVASGQQQQLTAPAKNVPSNGARQNRKYRSQILKV